MTKQIIKLEKDNHFLYAGEVWKIKCVTKKEKKGILVSYYHCINKENREKCFSENTEIFHISKDVYDLIK